MYAHQPTTIWAFAITLAYILATHEPGVYGIRWAMVRIAIRAIIYDYFKAGRQRKV
jgi:hypothetical protein